VGVGVAAGLIGLGMTAVLAVKAARWLRGKYRWWMAPAGAAAAGYVMYFTQISETIGFIGSSKLVCSKIII